MPYPTITERYGSLSATGLAVEAANAFGTPVLPTTWLPMAGNTMEPDPGWFSPGVMMGTRDKQVFNMYGEAKFAGAIDGPLFPSNAMQLLVASIGADATAGHGVTGSTPASATTLAGAITAGTNAISLTSATGYAVGSIIQVDVNGSGPVTTAECRKIATLTGTTGTVDTAWTYGHLTGAAVSVVVAPFTHTVLQQNTLPSLTAEKVLGAYQSLQFAGCRVNKMSVKAPVGNEPVSLTADLMGQSAAILTSPSAIAVTNEIPFVFAEASLTLMTHARADVSNVQLDIENGVKESYTYSGQHGPSFLTPVTVATRGTFDVVWSSLNDATYGDYQTMQNGTLGALALSFTHPGSGGYGVTFNLPQVVLSKYGNDVKLEDVIMSSISYEASRPLSGTSQYTISATVTNGVYLGY